MKQKEGRDFVTLKNTIASVRDKIIRVSDSGSTLELTLEDWEKLKDFVEKQKAQP